MHAYRLAPQRSNYRAGPAPDQDADPPTAESEARKLRRKSDAEIIAEIPTLPFRVLSVFQDLYGLKDCECTSFPDCKHAVFVPGQLSQDVQRAVFEALDPAEYADPPSPEEPSKEMDPHLLAEVRAQRAAYDEHGNPSLRTRGLWHSRDKKKPPTEHERTPSPSTPEDDADRYGVEIDTLRNGAMETKGTRRHDHNGIDRSCDHSGQPAANTRRPPGQGQANPRNQDRAPLDYPDRPAPG